MQCGWGGLACHSLPILSPPSTQGPEDWWLLTGQATGNFSYLQCFVVHIFSLRVCFGGHQPGLNQIFIKTVPKSSNRDMVCRKRGQGGLAHLLLAGFKWQPSWPELGLEWSQHLVSCHPVQLGWAEGTQWEPGYLEPGVLYPCTGFSGS